MKIQLITACCIAGLLSASAQTPAFDWVKPFGDASASMLILSTATSISGDIFMTGIFTDTVDFDPGAAVFKLSDAGFGDLFVAKMDSAGHFEWAKQIGGASYDEGRSIVVDPQGNVYVTGFYSLDSTDFDPGAGTFFLPNAGGARTFVLKLDTDGNFVWAKQIESQGSNSPKSLVLDPLGNILMTGVFDGTADFDPGAGVSELTCLVSSDIYILKLNPDGDFIWAKQIQTGTTATRSYAIAADAAGNMYVTGLLLGTVDFDPGAGIFNLTKLSGSVGGSEYVVKLDASGSFVWAVAIHGQLDQSHNDRAILADAAGNTYTTGWFNDLVDFDPGAGVHTLTSTLNEAGSIYLLKLDTEGQFAWASQFGDANNDNDKALALDASGNVYEMGTIDGGQAVDFDPGPGVFNLNGNNGNSFVAKYKPSGALAWALNFSHSISGSGQLNTIHVDPSGNVITSGMFNGTADFDPGAGVVSVTGNNNNVFIHKMSQGGVSGANEVEDTDYALSVFPNPSDGAFIIQTKAEGKYAIVNAWGQVMQTFTTDAGNHFTAAISGLEKGVYFVWGMNGEKVVGCKVLVW